MTTGRILLLLALLLGAVLRVPGWFTQEEMRRYRLFEIDEEQHLDLAMNRFNDLRSGRPDTIVHNFHDRPYNVRGYGYVVGYAAYAWYGLIDETPGFRDMLLLGRQLSTLFALLLILVVFQLGRVGGLSPPAAGVAALLMAACDVNATHAHYMVPASGYVLFAWLTLLGGVRLVRRGNDWQAMVMMAVGAAGAIGFKFDVFSLVWGGLLLIFLTAVGKFTKEPYRYAVVGISPLMLLVGIGLVIAGLLFFLLGWPWGEVVHTFTSLRAVNDDAIPVDDHLRDNLLLYPVAIMAGIGIPAFGLAVRAAVKLVAAQFVDFRLATFWRNPRTLSLLYVAAFLLTEFILRWWLDAAFVRRVNVFMPAVALLAAWSLQTLKAKPWLTSLVLAWSVGLAVVGQSNHWFDTRYAMRDWLNAELPAPAKVGLTGYTFTKDIQNGEFFLNIDWDYLVTHETFHGRYTERTMTTPFGVPKCTEEVYHPLDSLNCVQLQEIFMGRNPEVQLIKRFTPRDYFPERLIYRRFFGYYESFLGEVRVYKRS